MCLWLIFGLPMRIWAYAHVCLNAFCFDDSFERISILKCTCYGMVSFFDACSLPYHSNNNNHIFPVPYITLIVDWDHVRQEMTGQQKRFRFPMLSTIYEPIRFSLEQISYGHSKCVASFLFFSLKRQNLEIILLFEIIF